LKRCKPINTFVQGRPGAALLLFRPPALWCSAVIALIIAFSANAREVSPYLKIESFSYSEPIAIGDAVDGFDGPFYGGENALTHNWAETGVRYGKWGVGILGRYDYETEFSRDAAEFLYKIDNKQDLTVNKRYDIALNVRNTRSEGVRFFFRDRLLQNLQAELGVSYLKGIGITEGYIEGQATALAENDYDFRFYTDYVYEKDLLFDRPVDAPNGAGFSVDLQLDWRILPKLNASLVARDLYGVIRWEDAPYTKATATSDVKEFDEDGYVVYKPNISGIESNRDFTQKLPIKAFLTLAYTVTAHIDLLGDVLHYKSNDFFQLGAAYQANDRHRFDLMYMLDVQAVTLAYHWKYAGVRLSSDSFDLGDARLLGLKVNVWYPF
jgi:hypothetical protein